MEHKEEYTDYTDYAEAYACFAAGNSDGVISEETLEWLLKKDKNGYCA